MTPLAASGDTGPAASPALSVSAGMSEQFPAKLCVLVIGDRLSAQMQPLRAALDAIVERGADLRVQAAVPSALTEDPGASWFPDLVIVCQHWPDEYSERDVRWLLSSYSLARLVCVYGPWCESDGRTRDIWPFSVRVPVRCSADRIGRELEVIAGASPPLPLTASRDEVFLFDLNQSMAERLASPCPPEARLRPVADADPASGCANPC